MQRKSAFSRRLPDLVTEEIVSVLIENRKKPPLAWGVIFELMHARLKKRNAASGGEEMLRLRGYEKLKNLVDQNMVEKLGGKIPGQAKFRAKSTIENALVTIEPATAGVNPDTLNSEKPAVKKSPVKAPAKVPAKAVISKTTPSKPVKKAASSAAKPAKKILKVAKVNVKVASKVAQKKTSPKPKK